jgi:hypothetical protein
LEGSISIIDISTPPNSPSSHGKKFPLGVCLKRLASWHFLIPIINASFTTPPTSDPEYPSESSPSFYRLSYVKSFGVFPNFIANISALAAASGSGIYILFSNLLLIAESSSQGTLVAPNTKIPSLSNPTPCIYTRNSVFILLEVSFSPSLLLPQSESTSSIKITEGFFSLAISKRFFTSLSDSPIHLDTKSDELTDKNVPSASVAHAFAKKLFPVPGG